MTSPQFFYHAVVELVGRMDCKWGPVKNECFATKERAQEFVSDQYKDILTYFRIPIVCNDSKSLEAQIKQLNESREAPGYMTTITKIDEIPLQCKYCMFFIDKRTEAKQLFKHKFFVSKRHADKYLTKFLAQKLKRSKYVRGRILDEVDEVHRLAFKLYEPLYGLPRQVEWAVEPVHVVKAHQSKVPVTVQQVEGIATWQGPVSVQYKPANCGGDMEISLTAHHPSSRVTIIGRGESIVL